MEQALSARILAAALLALPLLGAKAPAAAPAPDKTQVAWAEACKGDDGWDTPGPPFRIHGNTWYVGTCGIAAILIRGKDGAVLIDSGTAKGSEIVEANIRSLGVRLDSVKAILASHEHFDHVAGFARLQGLTGAPVLVGTEAAGVIRTGKDDPRDPQFGLHPPMAPVTGSVRGVKDGEALTLAGIKLTAIATPGHTPGATSWSWRSCAGKDCRTIVYADSLNPISGDAYRFSDHADYVAAFRAGLGRLRAARCDILLTPHPGSSDMPARARGGTMAGGMSCAQYADAKTKALDDRLVKEAAAQ